jgi:uridine phosphorylase
MSNIAESELILNPDGSLYHLSLKPENIADTIITVGDPGRVYRISQYFEKLDFEMNKREFITHTGRYKGKRISVISTGMGTDNIEILLTELDALVNIDLESREIKKRKKKLNFIRIGTSGAIQADIKLGTLLVSENAFGLDNLSAFYDFPQDDNSIKISQKLKEKLKLPFTPYGSVCSEKLRKIIAFDLFAGNSITAPGFYGPQGRMIRIDPKNPKMLDELEYFHEDGFWFTNFDMESSVYYALGKMMGHEVLSLSAIIANRIKKTFYKNVNQPIDKLIKIVLDRIHLI